MAKKYVIGIDLGGTKILTALADAKGKILAEAHLFTGADKGQKEVIGRVKKTVFMVLEKAGASLKQVKCIGVGAPGPVISSKGLIVAPPNLPGWKSVPLGKILKQAFKVPVILENDANAAALAEFYFGAARGTKNCVYLTVSTGIGGGIIIEGKLYRGANFTAAEIGHIPINENGPLCSCGGKGCLERYVGNKHILQTAKKRLKNKNVTLEDLTQLAKDGNRIAIEIWQSIGKHIGIALAGVVNVLNPSKIVIGGGVSGAGRILFSAITNTIKERAMPQQAKQVKVLRASLGSNAGIIGASILVRRKLNYKSAQ